MNEAIHKIKKLMIDVATGKTRINDVNSEYQLQWDSLDHYYQLMGIPNPNPYRDLWEFWAYCKENLPNYVNRRVYIAQLYDGSGASPSSMFDLWVLLHPSVVAVAKSRFETKHFADAVEAALKEVNSRVKAFVRKKIGEDLDGSVLMKKAFSPQHPIISLGDPATESGRSMQQGYMELFSGSMSAVRNPNAHANVTISSERCIEFLFLASLLMAKLDEADVLPYDSATATAE